MQKVRRPFNILILYISLFDFFFNHVYGGDSNDAVLSSEYLVVYHYMQRLAVVQVYRQSYHVSDSKIMYHYYVLGRQQWFACDGIQITRTTAQVASFESPP